MWFKLILDPVEAKIHPSEIFQKMKKFTFMSTFELVKARWVVGNKQNKINCFLYKI